MVLKIQNYLGRTQNRVSCKPVGGGKGRRVIEISFCPRPISFLYPFVDVVTKQVKI